MKYRVRLQRRKERGAGYWVTGPRDFELGEWRSWWTPRAALAEGRKHAGALDEIDRRRAN